MPSREEPLQSAQEVFLRENRLNRHQMLDRPNLPITDPIMRVTEEELRYLIDGMDQAEKGGQFDGLFQPPTHTIQCIASKEQLLQSIRPDMKLTKNFFMRVYGYDMTQPGFVEITLDKLEAAGCSRAREYYTKFISEYEAQQEASIKPVAAQYRTELERKWKQEEKQKEGVETRKMQEVAPLQLSRSQKWQEGLY